MSGDTPHKGLRREPKAVTKPRVGNPWRESVQGNVNAPTMRVRGGAPNGMPVPSWQADGAPVAPREVPSTDTATTELQSVRRAYNVGSPTMPNVGSELRPHIPTARDRYPVGRPSGAAPMYGDSVKGVCAVDAPVMGPRIVHPFVSRMERFATTTYAAAVAACVQWETAHARALDALYDTAPSHVGATDHERAVIGALRVTADALRAELPSVHRACEETVTLAREAYPDARGERTIAPRALVPYDPTRETDLHGRDPNARWDGPTRRDAVSWDNAVDPSLDTRVTLDAVAPTMAPHRRAPVSQATRETLRQVSPMGDAIAALADMLPSRKGVSWQKGIAGGLPTTDTSNAVHPCPWCGSLACDRARDTCGVCRVYEWAGGDRGPKRPRVAPLPEWSAYVKAREAFKGPRAAHKACAEWIEDGRQATVSLLRRLDSRGVSIDHDRGAFALHDGTDKGRQAARDAFHGTWRVAPRECGARASGGVCVLYARAVPRQFLTACLDGAHWRLVRWEYLRECLSTATAAALSSIIEDTPRGVWWRDAILSWSAARDAFNGTEIALVRKCRDSRDPSLRQSASAPASAPRAPLPRVVAPTGVERIAPRIARDAPVYPVTPRKRTGDDASQCTPERGAVAWRDAPIEELASRVTRR